MKVSTYSAGKQRAPAPAGASGPNGLPAQPLGTGMETQTFNVGSVLCDRYRIHDTFGNEGPTCMYRVRDERAAPGASGELTIKTLRPELHAEPHWNQRLKQEFEQTVLLKHPHIARMHELQRHGRQLFIVMEPLDGKSLMAELRSHAPLPAQRTAEILTACCQALSFAHTREVVHSDLRPENIFLLRDGGVRLMGFGSIPAHGLHLPTSALSSANTEVAYASPQIVGSQRPDPRDDIFSLACIAHELLCGRPMQREIVDARVRCSADPSLPRACRDILERAFAWRREDRPAQIDHLLELVKTLGPIPTNAPKTTYATTHAPGATPETAIVTPTIPERDAAPLPEHETVASQAGLETSTCGELPVTEEAVPEALSPPASEPAAVEAKAQQTAVLAPPPVVQHLAATPQHAAMPQEIARVLPAAPTSEPPVLTKSTQSPPSPTVPKHEPQPLPSIAAVKHETAAPAVRNPSQRPTRRRFTFDLGRIRFTRRVAGVAAVLLGIVICVIAANREYKSLGTAAAPPVTTSAGQNSPPQVQPALIAPVQAAAPPPAATATEAPKRPRVAPRPQQIAFTADAITVSSRAAAVALTLERSNGRSGRVRIGWRIKEDTAVAGRDFNAPLSGSIEFADLQTVRSLFIPLSPATAGAQSGDPRTFIIELTSASNGARVSAARSVAVTIRDFS